MTVFGWLIAACWATLVVYWCVVGVRTVGKRWIWWREITLRLGFFASIMLTAQIEAGVFNTNWLLGLPGFLLTAAGVGLAIGARRSLGPNWVASASNSELITTGVYASVRHPLYGGLLLAILGSALGQSLLWLLPAVVYGPGFVASARREEQQLIDRFSDRYRTYMRRTNMFVPGWPRRAD